MKRSFLSCIPLVLALLTFGCTDTMLTPAPEPTNPTFRPEALTHTLPSVRSAGPIILIPFSATVDFTTFDPGPDYMDDQVWYLRNLTKYGVLTGDLEGTLTFVVHGDIDLNSGSGPAWGTFSLETDEGTYSGTLTGTFDAMAQILTCSLKGQGQGALAHQRIRGSASDGGYALDSETFDLQGEIASQGPGY